MGSTASCVLNVSSIASFSPEKSPIDRQREPKSSTAIVAAYSFAELKRTRSLAGSTSMIVIISAGEPMLATGMRAG